MKKTQLSDSAVNIPLLQEKVEAQLTRDFKKGNGVFFTPYKIIQRLIDLADVNIGDKILDPSCALGQFLCPAIGREKQNKIEAPPFFSRKLKNKICLYFSELRSTEAIKERLMI